MKFFQKLFKNLDLSHGIHSISVTCHFFIMCMLPINNESFTFSLRSSMPLQYQQDSCMLFLAFFVQSFTQTDPSYRSLLFKVMISQCQLCKLRFRLYHPNIFCLFTQEYRWLQSPADFQNICTSITTPWWGSTSMTCAIILANCRHDNWMMVTRIITENELRYFSVQLDILSLKILMDNKFLKLKTFNLRWWWFFFWGGWDFSLFLILLGLT